MSHTTTPDWSATADPELVRFVGTTGKIGSVDLPGTTLEHLDASMQALAGELASREGSFDMADVCPDPIVYAVNSGLPRLRVLDRQIDGGSQWRTLRPIGPGSVTVVPRISSIDERVASDGRRMLRTTYEISAYTTRGENLGVAHGFSLDLAEGGQS